MLTQRSAINTGLLVCPMEISLTFSRLYVSAANNSKTNKPFKVLQLACDGMQLAFSCFLPTIHWFVVVVVFCLIDSSSGTAHLTFFLAFY